MRAKYTRAKYSILNASTSSISRVLEILISFLVRTYFIQILGSIYLGVNGVLTNVLSILSIAELGFGTVLISTLYKPVAENDKELTKSLMRLYGRVYQGIGCFIFICGLCMMPFINYFFKGGTIPDIHLIFFLYLLNSASSYFFAYKRSIINANQMNFIVILIRLGFVILQTGIQLVALISFQSFLLYTYSTIFCTITQNVAITMIANKMFPVITEKEVRPIPKKLLQEIKKNIKAVMIYKMSGAVLNGTDNLVISSFVGVVWAGIYSNYGLIINAVLSVVSQTIASVTGSVGNLTALESDERKHETYLKIFFVNAWIYGVCAVCLFQLISPFIHIWVGDDYLLDKLTVALIVANFYTIGLQATTTMFRTAMGLFWYGRWRPLWSVIINLTSSIILCNLFGIAGVFIGTLISTIAVLFWYDPLVIHKYGFHQSSKTYFIKYTAYASATISAIVLNRGICSFFDMQVVWGFIYCCFISFITPNLVFYSVFHRSREYKYYKSLLKGMIRNKIQKRKE